MRIAIIGGGPAGLYFAILTTRALPEARVTVVERNRPFDTFGWGVVFSDATMQAMRQWDPPTAATIDTVSPASTGGSPIRCTASSRIAPSATSSSSALSSAARIVDPFSP